MKRKQAKRANKGGRPTKYKASYCQELIKFFDIEPWEEREINHYKGEDVSWTDVKLLPNRMPTLGKFAKFIGVNRDTVYEWAKKHKEFSGAFMCAKEIRKEWLIDGGLAGVFPPASFKFVAINVTDMTDKREEDLDVNIKQFSELLELIDGSSRGLPE